MSPDLGSLAASRRRAAIVPSDAMTAAVRYWWLPRRRPDALVARAMASLTDRDVAVVSAISDLHVASTAQLRRLFFDVEHSTVGSAARTAQRTLARLERLELLERLERSIGGTGGGSRAALWRLTKHGAKLVDGTAPASHRAEPSLSRLAHVLDVGELVVRLHEHARVGSYEVVEIQTEPACWRLHLPSRYGRRYLKPDLRVTIGLLASELHHFVEVDRATEHRPVLRRKAAAYVRRGATAPSRSWPEPSQRSYGSSPTTNELRSLRPSAPSSRAHHEACFESQRPKTPLQRSPRSVPSRRVRVPGPSCPFALRAAPDVRTRPVPLATCRYAIPYGPSYERERSNPQGYLGAGPGAHRWRRTECDPSALPALSVALQASPDGRDETR